MIDSDRTLIDGKYIVDLNYRIAVYTMLCYVVILSLWTTGIIYHLPFTLSADSMILDETSEFFPGTHT